MFSDPNTALMALVILNFAGTLLMFLFVLRSQDNTQKLLLEHFSQMQMRLADLEYRVAGPGSSGSEAAPASGADPFSNEDDLATMLENHAAKTPPPFSARSVAPLAESGGSLPDFLSLDNAGAKKRKDAVMSPSGASSLDIKLG